MPGLIGFFQRYANKIAICGFKVLQKGLILLFSALVFLNYYVFITAIFPTLSFQHIHLIFFTYLLFLTYSEYLLAVFTPPGSPKVLQNTSIAGVNNGETITTVTAENIELLESGQSLPNCRLCGAIKPPRSHHCRICGRCILKMDHRNAT